MCRLYAENLGIEVNLDIVRRTVRRFDPDNGLLLNRNIDSLFDLGYVTFSPDGYIIPSRYLDGGVLSYIGGARIYDGFINDRRMYYMGYHRANVFEKNFSIPYIMKYNQLK